MKTPEEIIQKYEIVKKRTWISPTVLSVLEWVLEIKNDDDMSFDFGDDTK